MRRVVKILPMVLVAIGTVMLVFGFGFIFLGHGLQPSGGAQAVNLESYSYVVTASFQLRDLANWAGLALLVVGVALLMLAWLAANWPKITRLRPT